MELCISPDHHRSLSDSVVPFAATAAAIAVAVSKAGYRAPKAVIAGPDTTLANPAAVPFYSIIEPLQIENVFQADRRPYDRPQQQADTTSRMALPPRAHHDVVTGTQRRHDDQQQYAAPGASGHVVDDGTVTAASTTASDQYRGLLILHEAAKRLHPVMRPLPSATTTTTSSSSSCTNSSMVDHHDHQHDQYLQSAITVDPLPFESVFSMARIQE
jgi:hypothetical protein